MWQSLRWQLFSHSCDRFSQANLCLHGTHPSYKNRIECISSSVLKSPRRKPGRTLRASNVHGESGGRQLYRPPVDRRLIESTRLPFIRLAGLKNHRGTREQSSSITGMEMRRRDGWPARAAFIYPFTASPNFEQRSVGKIYRAAELTVKWKFMDIAAARRFLKKRVSPGAFTLGCTLRAEI